MPVSLLELVTGTPVSGAPDGTTPTAAGLAEAPPPDPVPPPEAGAAEADGASVAPADGVPVATGDGELVESLSVLPDVPSDGLPVVPRPRGLTLSRLPQSITLPGMTSAALLAGG